MLSPTCYPWSSKVLVGDEAPSNARVLAACRNWVIETCVVRGRSCKSVRSGLCDGLAWLDVGASMATELGGNTGELEEPPVGWSCLR